MKTRNLKAAALLCSMFVTSAVVQSEEISSFEDLKSKLTSVDELDIQQDISFDTGLIINSGETSTIKGNGSVRNFTKDAGFSADAAFTNSGTLNLSDININGFDTAIINNTNSSLNTSGETTISGAITNSGTITNTGTTTISGALVNTDKSYIYNNAGTLNFNGTVSGTGHISNRAIMNINGDASGFINQFYQEVSPDSVTNVNSGGSFFAHYASVKKGTLNFNGGTFKDCDIYFAEGATLNWNNGNFVSGAVNFSGGGDLNVLNGTLNIIGGSTIINATNISIAQGGILAIGNTTNSYASAITGTDSGTGTLQLSQGAKFAFNSGASFDGTLNLLQGSEFTFNNGSSFNGGLTSNEAKIIVNNNSNVVSTILDSVNTGNQALDLTINSTTGTTKDINVNGTNLKTLTFSGTSDYSTGTITSSGDGTININGSFTQNSGTISNGATLNINNGGTYTQTGGTISNSGTLNVNGTFSGSGTISNSGTLNVNGTASGYTGTFTQSGGTTIVGENASFFTGSSTISGGNLTWLAGENSDSVRINFEGGTFIVGHDDTPEGSALRAAIANSGPRFVVRDGSSVALAATILINSDGTLSFATDSTINGTISGNGTLEVDNAELSFEGDASLADGLTFVSTNGTVNVENAKNASAILAVIMNNVEESIHSNLVLSDINTVNTSYTVDGEHIDSITFKNTQNNKNILTGDLNISGAGKVTNEGDLTLQNVALTGVSSLTSQIDNNNNATLTFNGDITSVDYNTMIKNYGTVIINGDASGYKGTYMTNPSSTITTVNKGANFFGGHSVLDSYSTLNWYTQHDLSADAYLEICNLAKINVGNGSDEANLTIENKNAAARVDFINGELTINQNGTFTVKGFNGEKQKTFYGEKITGNGTFVIDNSDIVFDNSNQKNTISSTIQLQSKNNSSLTLKNASDIADSVLTLLAGTNDDYADQNLNILKLESTDVSNSNLTVDGQHIKNAIFNSANFGENTTIDIKKQGTVTVINQFDEKGKINNEGTLNIGDITSNKGSFILDSKDAEALNNKTGGVINIYESSSVSINGKVVNDGIINNIGSSSSITFTDGSSLSGSGTINNSSDFIVNTDLSNNEGNNNFTGDFYQTAGGKTNVSGTGSKLFGGNKYIQDGSLTLSATGEIDYENIFLGEQNKTTAASLTHIADAQNNGGTISNSVLQFVGKGATATFTTNSSDTIADYHLEENLSGASGNNIVFENANLTLGETTYNGNFTLTNTKLDLINSTPDACSTYTFDILNGTNNTLDFNINLKSNQKLDTDVIKAGGNATFTIGKVKITGEENENGLLVYETEQDVLQGDGLKFAGSTSQNVEFSDLIAGATTSYEYQLKVTDDLKSVILEATNIANGNSLNRMNIYEGQRFFQFTQKDSSSYTVSASLDTTSDGTFYVFGRVDKEGDIPTDVISGNSSYDFFKITDNTDTKLYIDDLIIEGASGSSGSVVKNESDESKIVLKNTIIRKNKSTGNGGAIYNNGGNGVDPENENATGLYVIGSTFTDNESSGDGAAIYNDTKGFLYLDSVTVSSANGNAKNDIFNNGTAIVQGTNTFDSLVTNSGNITFNSTQSTIAEFVNNGADAVADFAGTNIIASATNTLGTMNFGGRNTIQNITNTSGNTNFIGNNTINGTFTNAATSKNTANLTINGTMKTDSIFENDGVFTLSNGAFITNTEDYASEFTNRGGLQINGDASQYTGVFVQDAKSKDSLYADEVTTNVTGKFFGGSSIIDAGNLNWLTENDISDDALLLVNKGTLTIGDGNNKKGTLTIKNGSSVSESVVTNIMTNGKLTVSDEGDVTISKDSLWAGTLEINDENANLTISGAQNRYKTSTGAIASGILNATAGALTLTNDSIVEINVNSQITKGVVTDLQENSTISVTGGTISIDDNDTWNGNIIAGEGSTGTINIDGFNTDSSSDNGLLQAFGGTVNITNDSNITLQKDGEYDSVIAKEAVVNILGDSVVNVTNGGSLTLNEGEYADTWEGTVNLTDGGTFNYGMTDITGTLTASGGNLNLLEGSILTIQIPSVVAREVAVDIQKGATVKIHKDAEFTIDAQTNDKWNGLVVVDGGKFRTEGIDNQNGQGGGLQQSSGSSTFTDKSNIVITDTNSFITGGDVSILNNSTLAFGQGVTNLNVDNLYMNENSTLGMLNNDIYDTHVGNMSVEGNNNFTIDLDPRHWKGDTFDVDSLTSTSGGNVNISDFDFQGGAPIDRYIEYQIFDADKIGDNITFSATDKQIFTPIGWYGLESLGEGRYRSRLNAYNPQVFRGQVATLAMYNNQLFVDNLLTNHFILHDERLVERAKNANKYSAAGVLFAPYQHTYEEGGLWNKSYASLDRMNLTRGLDVGNNVYGTLVGADFPAIDLQNDWKFIPTGYVGYNGGHQHFNSVSMYQNGGQLGFMGTFLKDNFVGSVTAYGGGYINEMNLEGFSDETGNWFAGTAAKVAYNLNVFKDFTIQPTAFIAYNAFGQQNWGSNFGIMGMDSSMLNGINIAPGLNFILKKDTWSLYATTQYMFYINDKIDGHAGNVHLPNVRMDHGYLQYGIGGTKVLKDQLALYGQMTLQNVGLTGIGFQAGLNYMFDLNEVSKKFSKKTKNVCGCVTHSFTKIIVLFKK